MTARVLTWDWRQQPDLDRLAAAIRDLTGGNVGLHQVDTGSDEYAIVLADQLLTDAEARSIWEAS